MRGELTGSAGDTEQRLVSISEEAGLRLRLNGREERSIARFARLLPIQVITTECTRVLTEGPGERRALLNWGVFHVEHGFADAWRNYRRALRQRNHSLRQRDARTTIAWEPTLARAGEAVHRAYSRYLERMLPKAERLAASWLPELSLSWIYRRGWGENQELRGALASNRDRELERGYTLAGPHRADLRLRALGTDARSVLSRGQLKLAVIALQLAQLGLHGELAQTTPVLLLDDLAAELDDQHLRDILAVLDLSNAQTVLTTLEPDRLRSITSPGKMFHVEQGHVTEMI